MGDHRRPAGGVRGDHALRAPSAEDRGLPEHRRDRGLVRALADHPRRRAGGGRRRRHSFVRVVPGGTGRVRPRGAHRRVDGGDAGGGLERVATRAGVLAGVHGGRPRLRALLRLHEPLHHGDAGAGPGRQPVHALHLLGAGGPFELPAHRLLVPQAERRGRRQEGVHRDAHRRPRAAGRDPAHLDASRDVRHPRNPRPGHLRRARRDDAHAVRAGAVRGGGRQERAVPAARVASRCDGGPNAGLRPHPRGHDGRGGRLPDGALLPGDRSVAERTRYGRLDRGGDGHRGRLAGARADGPETGARLLHDQPARLHDAGAGRVRVRGGGVPPVHARLLQGAAVPRERLGEPRDQHVRHAPDGRPAHGDADHVLDVPDRHAQPLRGVPAGRFLVEGRDPAGGVGE